MTQDPVLIEVYSDVICPWCYVGKRRLEQALQHLDSAMATKVVWRPFQLNPGMPQEGMDRTAYLEAKFGSRGAYRRLEEEVRAAEGGLAWAFDEITVTPNTLAAHRLIWYADRFGLQDAVVEELFRCYFVEGRHIGRRETLVEAAGRAGLDRNDAETFLAGDGGVDEVRREEAISRGLGIRAVPCFVFNGASMLTGAQPADVLRAAIAAAGEQGSGPCRGRPVEPVARIGS
ncbi:MAG: DsbA family oxidoreductase [Nitrospira sp.]|nr:DsbA family oxidoreductase [Nitrospira sp.]